MAEIVQIGDPVLRQKAEPLAKKDIPSRKVQGLLRRMRTALQKEEHGVAIAAPQVGEPLRIFVVAGKVFEKEEEEGETPADKVFINPELARLSRKKLEMAEGCLSVRGKYGTVLRHERATVRALDEKGKPFTYHGSGLLSHIFQHELDHLEGILYTDKAVKLVEDEDPSTLAQKKETLRKKHPA